MEYLSFEKPIEELENQPIISEILKSFDGTIEPDSISTKEWNEIFYLT